MVRLGLGVSRHARLAVLALVASAGCRAAGTGVLRPEAPVANRSASHDAEQVIAKVNRNARLVQSLRAEPSITASQGGRKFGVTGRMAMERPQNFKLELNSTMHKEADLGSNDAGFWFWTRQSDPKVYYVGKYDQVNASPETVIFEPDWIVEAMGLREIPPEDLAAMKVERRAGPQGSALLAFTQRRKTRNGDSYTKVMTVDPVNSLILEQRIYAGDQKALLARAEVVGGRYARYAVTPPDSADTDAYADEDRSSPTGTYVYLPQKVKLEWVREKMELTVSVGRPEINVAFGPELFEEPKFAGYARVNIAEQTGMASGRTTIRESRPAPPSGVRLSEPEPLGGAVESNAGASLGRRRNRSRPPEPAPLMANLSDPAAAPSEGRAIDRLVRARVPSAPQSTPAWMPSEGRMFEP